MFNKFYDLSLPFFWVFAFLLFFFSLSSAMAQSSYARVKVAISGTNAGKVYLFYQAKPVGSSRFVNMPTLKQ